MIKKIFFLFFLLNSILVMAQEKNNDREMIVNEGETSYILKKYFLCIYLKGPNRSQTKELADSLQSKHLAYISEMDKAGAICMAGPFGDDTDKRGILMFDVSSIEDAENWVKNDPMVLAGRLTYEIHPWWGAKGSTLK
jgi:uncharacterized protein